MKYLSKNISKIVLTLVFNRAILDKYYITLARLIKLIIKIKTMMKRELLKNLVQRADIAESQSGLNRDLSLLSCMAEPK